MIQIRNVPDAVHRQLKARAAEMGLTLSDFLLRIAEREVRHPPVAELAERIRRSGPVVRGSSADVVRDMRDGRS